MINPLEQFLLLPQFLQASGVFLFGLMLGSFSNVCIHRIPRGESVVSPGSHCVSCNAAVRSFDNIPLLSYLILKGQCRNCGVRFSWVYPFIEFITALLIVASFYRFGWSWEFAIFTVVGPALVVITVIDLQHKIIPNLITLPGIPLCLIAGIYLEGTSSALWGLVAGSGLFLLIGEIYYRMRGEIGMGMGDVKYIAAAGALLGWQKIFLVIFIAALIGSIVGVLGMVNKKLTGASQIPFGPFLAAGTLVAFFWGDALIHLYLSSLAPGYPAL
ncbi:MAG: prepilin peptidase [Candidatus Nitrohelix vancouverensis]|uniref:Prepilin leader peptidase/N-methyltransferase n=1 Tax=Candidatus Nitrohelix vancouverensis TaxID=2705534 RepID=A0A7T0C537_9BACT|nr:MAG: prepilin peptidase [Candidatus Nitrohelix vancouverensis]